MYKLSPVVIDEFSKQPLVGCVNNLNSGAFIPFDPANTDYQTFRKDVAGGVELQDAEGNVMTQAQVDDFLKTIPE